MVGSGVDAGFIVTLLLWQAPRYSNGIEGILVRGRAREHAEWQRDMDGGNDNWAKAGIWTLQARVVADCAAPPCVSVRDEENNEQSPALFVKAAQGGDQKIATLHGAGAAEARAHRCAALHASSGQTPSQCRRWKSFGGPHDGPAPRWTPPASPIVRII